MRFRPEPDHQHGQPARTGVLLCNLGTPDEPTAAATRRYLAEFLSDPRVVEIPPAAWKPILHGVILRTRPAKSAAKYQQIWLPEGSPLMVWSRKQSTMLRGYLDTDLPACNPDIRQVQCPFTGESLAAVPAINPDVTFLHAQFADRQGNVSLHGIVGACREAALAAKALVVSVEEVVEDLAPAMNAILLPHWVVDAVVHCPGGAYPSYAQGFYERDNAFYRRWDGIARDRDAFLAWMQAHVLDTVDQRAFLGRLVEAAA